MGSRSNRTKTPRKATAAKTTVEHTHTQPPLPGFSGFPTVPPPPVGATLRGVTRQQEGCPELCVDPLPHERAPPPRSCPPTRAQPPASPRSPQRRVLAHSRRPAPAPPPRPRGPLCLGGTFRLFPSRRPTGPAASPGSLDRLRTLSGGAWSPSPQVPQPAPHSRSPRRAWTCDRQDPHSSRPLTGVTIPAQPRCQLTSKCGDRGLRTGGRAERASGCRSGGGGRAEAPQAQASPHPPTSRLPLREGRRPPHAWQSPPLNMAPGPRSLADGPVLPATEPGRSEAAGRGLPDCRALGRPQPPLSFV